MSRGGLWDQLVDCICRPPRDSYQEAELIGGVGKKFRIGSVKGYREDCVVVNKKGLKLQCSQYFPAENRGKDGKLPCVVYCHCNSGSKRDGDEAVWTLIPLGVSVFTFDFSGSGLSDGDWVTLGANEADDLECVIDHLRVSDKCSTIGLWGRSMGAVTALMYSQRDPSVAGMVLDSPFSRLTDLMLEIVEEQRLPIPRAVTKMVLGAMRKSVKKRAGFDISIVTPLEVVKESYIPALFGHGEQDSFIKIHHSERLFEAYAGDKNMLRFEGEHNSRRPDFYLHSVSIFFYNSLRMGEVMQGGLDIAAVHQQSNSYRIHHDAARAGAQQNTVPRVVTGSGTDADLQTMADDFPAVDGDWDADDDLLRQVLALSLLDVGPTAMEGPSTGSAPPTAAPSAPPAPTAAQPRVQEDEDDADLRAAIEASLKEQQPGSLTGHAGATPAAGAITAPAKSAHPASARGPVAPGNST